MPSAGIRACIGCLACIRKEIVDRIKVGDRVVLPFNISCGFCANCERGFTN